MTQAQESATSHEERLSTSISPKQLSSSSVRSSLPRMCSSTVSPECNFSIMATLLLLLTFEENGTPFSSFRSIISGRSMVIFVVGAFEGSPQWDMLSESIGKTKKDGGAQSNIVSPNSEEQKNDELF